MHGEVLEARTLARHARRRCAGVGVVTTLVDRAPASLGQPRIVARREQPLALAWSSWITAARQAAHAPALEAVARATGRTLDDVRSILLTDDPNARALIARAAASSSEAVARALRDVLSASAVESDPPDVDRALAFAALAPELPYLVLDAPDAARVRWALAAVERCPALPIAITIRADALAAIERELTRSYADRLREGIVAWHASESADAFASAAGAHATALAPLAPRWREAADALDGRDRARSVAERLLYEALEALPETRGAFRLNHRLTGVRFGSRDAEIDLAAPSLCVAVEVDGPFHFLDDDAYRRDRRKDVLLQRAGYLVLRALATDVVERLEEVLDSILALVRHARAKTEIHHER